MTPTTLRRPMVVESNGNLVVAGESVGPNPVDIEGTLIPCPNGGVCIYVAKIDPTGNVLWAHAYSAGTLQLASAVAVDSQGDVVVTGSCGNTLDFGGGVSVTCDVSGQGDPLDAFVAKLDANGNALWALNFDGRGGTGIGIDPVTDDIVLGYLAREDNVVFEGTVFASAILTKLDPSGAHLWTATDVTAGWSFSTIVAVDVDGSVVAVDRLPTLTDRVVRRDADGTVTWALTPASTSFRGATFDAVGNVAIDGNAFADVDLGCGAFGPGAASAMGFALVLAPDQSCTWQHLIPGGVGYGIGIHSQGDVLLASYAASPADDFGTGPIGGVGHVVLRLSALDGAVTSARLWGPSALAGPIHVYPGGDSLWIHEFPLPAQLIRMQP